MGSFLKEKMIARYRKRKEWSQLRKQSTEGSENLRGHGAITFTCDAFLSLYFSTSKCQHAPNSAPSIPRNLDK